MHHANAGNFITCIRHQQRICATVIYVVKEVFCGGPRWVTVKPACLLRVLVARVRAPSLLPASGLGLRLLTTPEQARARARGCLYVCYTLLPMI